MIGCIAGTYRMASSQAGAAKLAIGAGVDMDFAGCSYTCKHTIIGVDLTPSNMYRIEHVSIPSGIRAV